MDSAGRRYDRPRTKYGQQIAVKVTWEVYERLEALASGGQTRSDVVRRFIAEGLARDGVRRAEGGAS